MKLSAFHALLAALAINHASAIALPDPDPEYYVIQNTDNGPVYSNVAPHQRRDTSDVTYYPVSTNADGTVYSSIDPNAKKQKRDDGPYKPVSQAEVEKFIEEHHIQPGSHGDGHEKRDGESTGLEKRNWQDCVACMAACGLMQQGISLLTVSQQVQFCLSNCALQGACTPWFRAKYGDRYGGSFPP